MSDPVVPLEQLVEDFLRIGYLEPETPPKRVRDQRDNRAMVIGYSKAQEHLRTILAKYGYDELAKRRHPDSPQPMRTGLGDVWVMS